MSQQKDSGNAKSVAPKVGMRGHPPTVTIAPIVRDSEATQKDHDVDRAFAGRSEKGES